MTLIAVAALLLAALSAVLIVHKQYEDGLIGRLALGFMLVMGLVFATTEIAGFRRYGGSQEIVILLLAVDAFMLRHLWRFLRWTRTHEFTWPTHERPQWLK